MVDIDAYYRGGTAPTGKHDSRRVSKSDIRKGYYTKIANNDYKLSPNINEKLLDPRTRIWDSTTIKIIKLNDNIKKIIDTGRIIK